MTKQELLKTITTDSSDTRDFISNYMADTRTYDFKLMLREAQNERGKVDHALIGRIFERAYSSSVIEYLSIKL